MSENSISSWCDITVEDATSLKNFYVKVMGWTAEAFNMGDYEDYIMKDAQGNAIGGICHAKGSNKSMPASWIQYFTVADLAESLKHVVANGGEQIGDIRSHGDAQFCVIKDPSGAFSALYQAS
ncbi:VOC family protein [Alteromonas sp. ASW11-130]|uniref:VOC family protein n=1 Tax=Alteromonas sp. ASW11-130 TaxID=3015775 RepID=UPI002241F87D|nr:VOC family protein [Alteromonas sp. ASW11-130]MCW8090640.1 VOC family protein [Alteromonas sp. ASW11-130]